MIILKQRIIIHNKLNYLKTCLSRRNIAYSMTLHWQTIQLITLLTIFLTSPALGQLKLGEISKPPSDVKVWTGIFLNQSITENLDFTLKTSYYTRCNVYRPRFSDVGLRYNFYKNMKLGAFYRFSNYFKMNEHRMYVEISDKFPVFTLGKNQGITIQSRLRWQQKINSETLEKKEHIRTRMTIKTQLLDTPIQPFISGELFFCYDPILLDKYRITPGFDYTFSENCTLRFFYRQQKERFVEAGKINKHNTFNLSYRFKL